VRIALSVEWLVRRDLERPGVAVDLPRYSPLR
jgi:hypothetical protein